MPESVAVSASLSSPGAESAVCTQLRAAIAAGVISPQPQTLVQHPCISSPAAEFQLLALLSAAQNAPWRAKGILLLLPDAAAEMAWQRRSCAATRGHTAPQHAVECLRMHQSSQALGDRAMLPGLLDAMLAAVAGPPNRSRNTTVTLHPHNGTEPVSTGRMTTAVHFSAPGGVRPVAARVATAGLNGVVADMDLPATLQQLLPMEGMQLAKAAQGSAALPDTWYTAVKGWVAALCASLQLPPSVPRAAVAMLGSHSASWPAFARAVLDSAFGATGQHGAWLERGLDAASVQVHDGREAHLSPHGKVTSCALAGPASRWCADLAADSQLVAMLQSTPAADFAPRPAAGGAPPHRLARVAERFIRAASNLEERLHVGYTLYLGWGDSFVTEGEYCPMLALMHLGSFLWLLRFAPGMGTVAGLTQMLPLLAVSAGTALWAQTHSMQVANVWGADESSVFLLLWLLPLFLVGTAYLRAVLACAPVLHPSGTTGEVSTAVAAPAAPPSKKWAAMQPAERLASITAADPPYNATDAYTAAVFVVYIMTVTLCTLIAFSIPLLFSATCVPLMVLCQSRVWKHAAGKAMLAATLAASILSLWAMLQTASSHMRTAAPALLESALLGQPLQNSALLCFACSVAGSLWVWSAFLCIA